MGAALRPGGPLAVGAVVGASRWFRNSSSGPPLTPTPDAASVSWVYVDAACGQHVLIKRQVSYSGPRADHAPSVRLS